MTKEINNIRIGDTYVDRNNYLCTVFDIYTVTSLKTGEIIRTEIMAQKEVCGCTVKFEVPRATIARYRCNNNIT